MAPSVFEINKLGGVGTGNSATKNDAESIIRRNLILR